MVKMMTLEERFSAKTRRNGPDECWSWIGCIVHGGYGQIRAGTRLRRAHQVALELAGAPQPSPRHFACHSCDNPSCVNPAHLWWGTHTDNVRDMLAKGRQRNQRKTHCDYGHALTPENLRPGKLAQGQRKCIVCDVAAKRRHYWAKRESA